MNRASLRLGLLFCYLCFSLQFLKSEYAAGQCDEYYADVLNGIKLLHLKRKEARAKGQDTTAFDTQLNFLRREAREIKPKVSAEKRDASAKLPNPGDAVSHEPEPPHSEDDEYGLFNGTPYQDKKHRTFHKELFNVVRDNEEFDGAILQEVSDRLSSLTENDPDMDMVTGFLKAVQDWKTKPYKSRRASSAINETRLILVALFPIFEAESPTPEQWHQLHNLAGRYFEDGDFSEYLQGSPPDFAAAVFKWIVSHNRMNKHSLSLADARLLERISELTDGASDFVEAYLTLAKERYDFANYGGTGQSRNLVPDLIAGLRQQVDKHHLTASQLEKLREITGDVSGTSK
jgi:hypothetical protein